MRSVPYGEPPVPYGEPVIDYNPPRGPPPRRVSSTASVGHVQKYPIFCLAAIVANAAVFVLEIRANGWRLQPFSCPSTCLGGMPCFEDGTPCEANPMLGPTVQVLDRLGAKNDVAIFELGQWWRIATCNWLHAGIIHAGLNMMAIWSVGGELEKAFGAWRVGLLYIFAGLFGTVTSIVFLPGQISVGASASVFGLVGANWADIIVNFCARCTLRGSGIVCLTFATVINVAFGFTPFVDNFMHLGGLVAGLVIGLASFAQKAQRDPNTGQRKHTWGQELVVLVAVLLLLILGAGAVAAVLSDGVKEVLRRCPFCASVNCLPMDKWLGLSWWSCCSMALQGSCLALNPPLNSSAAIVATCNMSHAAAPYEASCSPLDDDSCAYPSDMAPSDPRLGALCALICSGCSG